MAKVECTCLQCGEHFLTSQSKVDKGYGKYCSLNCWGKSQQTRVNHRCPQCGDEMYVKPSDLKSSPNKCCSRECRNTYYKEHSKQVELECPYCNKKFLTYPSSIKKVNVKYCSHKCADAANAIKRDTRFSKNCEYCGVSFLISNALKDQKYCSKRCTDSARVGKYAGDKSPLWRGGKITDYGDNWYIQRKLAYERDQGTCQYCRRKPNKKEKRFDVHHVVKLRKFNKDYIAANSLSNLITLCPQCHAKAERGKIALPIRLL